MLLDLMAYQSHLKIIQKGTQRFVFDPIRQKNIVIGPEELVRQLLILYLIHELGYNKNFINVEKQIIVNQLNKRCDILIYDKKTKPWMLIECKAPSVTINEAVFRQIAWYNMPLKVPYLLLCNGIDTYCCFIDYKTNDYQFIDELPKLE